MVVTFTFTHIFIDVTLSLLLFNKSLRAEILVLVIKRKYHLYFLPQAAKNTALIYYYEVETANMLAKNCPFEHPAGTEQQMD